MCFSVQFAGSQSERCPGSLHRWLAHHSKKVSRDSCATSSLGQSYMFYLWFNNRHHFFIVHWQCDWLLHYEVLLTSFFRHRYQHFSTTFTPHNSERQRERQRGLVKQTFELDEAAAAERQDEQVAKQVFKAHIILTAGCSFATQGLFLHAILILWTTPCCLE